MTKGSKTFLKIIQLGQFKAPEIQNPAQEGGIISDSEDMEIQSSEENSPDQDFLEGF